MDDLADVIHDMANEEVLGAVAQEVPYLEMAITSHGKMLDHPHNIGPLLNALARLNYDQESPRCTLSVSEKHWPKVSYDLDNCPVTTQSGTPVLTLCRALLLVRRTKAALKGEEAKAQELLAKGWRAVSSESCWLLENKNGRVMEQTEAVWNALSRLQAKHQ